MDILKVSTDNKLTKHEFPAGGYEVTHKFLTDLIGNGCDMLESVSPRLLYEGFGFTNDPYSGKGVVMLVDEEGRLKPNEMNGIGSFLYGTMVHGEPIVGNVLFVGLEYGPDGADFSGIKKEQLEKLESVINGMIK